MELSGAHHLLVLVNGHAGHLDHELRTEYKDYVQQPCPALPLPGPVLRIDGRVAGGVELARLIREAVA